MSCADEHTWVPWVCLNNKHLITVLLQGTSGTTTSNITTTCQPLRWARPRTPPIQPLPHITTYISKSNTCLKQMLITIMYDKGEDERTRIYCIILLKQRKLCDNKSYCKQDLIAVTYVLKQKEATSACGCSGLLDP